MYDHLQDEGFLLTENNGQEVGIQYQCHEGDMLHIKKEMLALNFSTEVFNGFYMSLCTEEYTMTAGIDTKDIIMVF
jgi:hypothetical protein